MEEKGWKERLRNLHKEISGGELFGSCASHNEGLDCCTEKKWLLDFIQRELDKAREEGRREGGQAFLRDTLSYCSFHNGKPRRLGDVEIVARELSKLTTK